MKIKVGLYIRVSTSEQVKEGYSIKEQTERLTKYSEAHDWTIYKTYTDPAYSGSSIDRPALSEMINDIKKNRIQKVIVYKLDRLSRRQKDTLYLIEDVFLPNNVDFVSMTENFDTGSPLGRAMIGILSVFAQLEREQIKERMQIGLDARAKEGFYHGGGYDPIGYNYKNGELIINDYEAMQIKKIAEMYLDGLPIHAITKWLTNNGYDHHYGQWTDASVRSCLFTPLYTGLIEWKGEKYEGRHTSIIDKETYDKIIKLKESRIANNPKKYSTPFKRTTLLGGLVFCGNCGARYYAKQNTLKKCKNPSPDRKAQQYYTCYSRAKSSKKMIKDPNCKNPNFNTKKLDAIILDEIRKLAIDENYLNELIDEKKQDSSPDKNILESKIADIDKQIKKLVDLYQISALDFNSLNERIDTLTSQKKALEQQIEDVSTIEPELDENTTEAIIMTIPDVLDKGTQEDKKVIVHSLINSIIIYNDHLEINWKFI